MFPSLPVSVSLSLSGGVIQQGSGSEMDDAQHFFFIKESSQNKTYCTLLFIHIGEKKLKFHQAGQLNYITHSEGNIHTRHMHI